jgi:hypothetical protein
MISLVLTSVNMVQTLFVKFALSRESDSVVVMCVGP